MYSATSTKVESIKIEGVAIQFDECGEDSFFSLLNEFKQPVYVCPTNRLVDCKAVDEVIAQTQAPRNTQQSKVLSLLNTHKQTEIS